MTARMALMLGVALLLTGCQTGQPVSEERDDAHQRWNSMRARMLCAVGEQHLKVGQLDQAREKAAEAVALAPEHLPARVLMGKVLIEEGYYEQAAGELTAACQLGAQDPEPVYLLGVALEKQGQLQPALDSYLRVLAMDDTAVHAVTAAGEVMVSMGQVNDARLFVEGHLRQAGNDPAMYELAGRLAAMQRDYETAAAHYTAAADLVPDNWPYREALGRTLYQAGEYARAVDVLEELTQAGEGYQVPAWLHTMRGDCYMQLRRPHDARRAYQTATDTTPHEPGVWIKLGKAELAMDAYEGAAFAARQALQLQPGSVDAALLMGFALLQNGQARQAVEVLRNAVRHNPEDSTLRCLLGRAYAAAGRQDLARTCYASALRLDPDNRLARTLLEAQAPSPKVN